MKAAALRRRSSQSSQSLSRTTRARKNLEGHTLEEGQTPRPPTDQANNEEHALIPQLTNISRFSLILENKGNVARDQVCISI